MVSFGEKAKVKKVGNLNQGRSYVITTVTLHCFLCLNFLGGDKKKGHTFLLSAKALPFCARRNRNLWCLWSSSFKANQTDWQKNTGSYR